MPLSTSCFFISLNVFVELLSKRPGQTLKLRSAGVAKIGPQSCYVNLCNMPEF